MSGENLKRMFSLIDEVFATRNDPDQIQVTPGQQKKLFSLHPATLSERADENGPYIWVLIIPTTADVMNDFISGKISENELLRRTEPGDKFEAIYLCSATTLPEYRNNGETKAVCVRAIEGISADHPVKYLFVWPFTQEGARLAESVFRATGIPLLKRE